jgi:hypothetical protein
MSKLLCGSLLVMQVTKVAAILVIIRSTERQWLDVIHYTSNLGASLVHAVFAQSMSAP